MADAETPDRYLRTNSFSLSAAQFLNPLLEKGRQVNPIAFDVIAEDGAEHLIVQFEGFGAAVLVEDRLKGAVLEARTWR